MRFSLLAVAVLAAGCSKCGSAAAVDAGFDAGTALTVRGERRSIELRTAVIQMFPEYRDVAVLSTHAKVTRTIPGMTDAQRDASLAKLGWKRSADGGTGWVLNRFHLEQRAPDTLVISLPIDIEALGLLFLAPSSISSLDIANYLPRDLPVGREVFEFEVHYVTSPARAALRVHQAASLLVANGQWKVTAAPEGMFSDAGLPAEDDLDAGAALDGGGAPVVVEVRSLDDAQVILERARGQVWAKYRWVTVGAGP